MFLSKLIEIILANHLTKHIMNAKLHNPRKSSYITNYNTETLLFYLTKNISLDIQNNNDLVPIRYSLFYLTAQLI